MATKNEHFERICYQKSYLLLNSYSISLTRKVVWKKTNIIVKPIGSMLHSKSKRKHNAELYDIHS